MTRPSQTADKFIVRLPDGMREKISEAASANNRTMTAEIVSRLARSFEQDETSPMTGVPGVTEELDQRLRLDKWELLTMIRALDERINKLGG